MTRDDLPLEKLRVTVAKSLERKLAQEQKKEEEEKKAKEEEGGETKDKEGISKRRKRNTRS